MPSKLKRAMSGARSNGNRGLRSAARALKSLRTRSANDRKRTADSVGGLVETGETLLTFAAAEYAEGYLGAEKMAPGGYVDLRATAVAPWLVGVGLEMFGGSTSRKVGKHVAALSQGAVMSYVGSKLRGAGQKMAARGSNVQDGVPPLLADPNAEVHGDDNVLSFDQLRSVLREIKVTDEAKPKGGGFKRAFRV